MPEETTAETPIENLSLPALFAMQEIAAARMIDAKFKVGAVAAELNRRLGDSVKMALGQPTSTRTA